MACLNVILTAPINLRRPEGMFSMYQLSQSRVFFTFTHLYVISVKSGQSNANRVKMCNDFELAKSTMAIGLYNIGLGELQPIVESVMIISTASMCLLKDPVLGPECSASFIDHVFTQTEIVLE